MVSSTVYFDRTQHGIYEIQISLEYIIVTGFQYENMSRIPIRKYLCLFFSNFATQQIKPKPHPLNHSNC